MGLKILSIKEPDKEQLYLLLKLSNIYFPEYQNEIHEFWDEDGELFIGCNNVITLGPKKVKPISAWTIHWVEWLHHLAYKMSNSVADCDDPTHLWFWQNTHPVDFLWGAYEEEHDEEE